MARAGDDWRALYQGDTTDSEFGYISYNETVIEHFMSPRNVGLIEDPDGHAVVGDLAWGDYIEVCIKVEQGRVAYFGKNPRDRGKGS